MDSVVHFEIPAKDPKRATTFYSKAFGWQISQFPNWEYWMIGTTPSDKNGMPSSPGAINGGMGKKSGPLQAPTVTIAVDDIDKTLENVKKLGGKIAAKKSPVGEMGFTAYFTDTEGNIIGLWQNAAK
ncbi:MAG TPA: VOC family protein [Nitrososphaerales archaeon]|nr:VOC family protein [Nitrososphaerales archaeon]